MPFPQDVLDFDYELFVNNKWLSVTPDVSDQSAVTFTRGRQDSAGRAEPCNVRFTLYNDTGIYSPPNPIGPYFGSLDVNTPLRITLGRTRDLFGRVVSNGWGTDWTTPKGSGGTVAAANYAVNGSAATLSVPVANGYRFAILTGSALRTVDVRAQASIPITTITGAAIWPVSVLLRGVSDTDWVYAGISIAVGGAVRVGIFHFDGTVIAPLTTVTGLTHSAAQALIIRAQAEGETFRVKAWAATADEPYAWQASGHFSRNTAPGWVGIMHLVETGNTNTMPIISTIDNVVVRRPRAAGELSDLRPQWGESEASLVMRVVAQGIRRRLGQGATPLLGAARRRINYILGTTVGQPYIKQWWPLEDGNDATRIEVGVTEGWQPVTWTSGVRLAGSSSTPGAPAGVSVSGNTNYVSLPIAPGTITTAWGIALAAQCDPGKAGTIYYIGSGPAGGELFSLRLVIGADGVAYLLRSFQDIGGVEDIIITHTVRAGGWVDHDWHHYIVACRQSGANVVCELWVDGVQVATHTSSPATYRTLHTVQLYTGTPYEGPLAVSHAVLLTGAPSSWHADTADAISDASLGHRGELAGRRIQRILAEEGIPFDYVGDLDTTPAMGPQVTAKLLDTLDHCADADDGTLFDPLGEVGFSYRTRRSAYSQTARLTLDYALEQVDPPFEPARDDKGLINDVRVGRVNGGSPFRAQLLTGRKSVLPPSQGGAGRYDAGYEFHYHTDEQTPGRAYWELAKGTPDDTRYPQVSVDIATVQFINAGLTDAALDIDIDDHLVILNPMRLYDPRTVRQLSRGYVETLRNMIHKMTFNTVPESPYRVAVVNGADNLVDAANSSLSGGPYSDSVGTLTVVSADPGGPWVTGAVTIDIDVAGEEMRVTNIAGATSPQTFTVLRSRNGVVKPQVAGAKVRLARPVKVGLS
jgi:hypothetical protein